MPDELLRAHFAFTCIMGWVVPIQFPFQWVILDVMPDALEGGFILQDAIIKTGLPSKIGIS
jgi:hypothetical protein